MWMGIHGEILWGVQQPDENMLDYLTIDQIRAVFDNAMHHLSGMKQKKITTDDNIFEFVITSYSIHYTKLYDGLRGFTLT